MPTLSRIQAEALLRTARAGRPLYDDLRPAYTRPGHLVALLPEARDVVIQREDPLAALRALWADADAIVAVHPGPPPLTGEGADAAAPARATRPPAAGGPARAVAQPG